MYRPMKADSQYSRSLFALAFAVILGWSASSAVHAAGTDEPAPSATPSTMASYDQAVKLIKAGKYKEGFAELKALNKTGDANVLNYMGYASRKMGDTRNAERYYKAALKINPKHRGALEYYGELMVQMGNAKGAQTHLATLKQICGTCEEYTDLKQAMQKAGIAEN